jgi:hypothetical protein
VITYIGLRNGTPIFHKVYNVITPFVKGKGENSYKLNDNSS